MARAASDDFLQNFRFHVTASLGDEVGNADDGFDPLKFQAGSTGGSGDDAVAGFQAVTIPDLSVNSAEYRTGIRVFTRKQPGIPTFTDITLMRGVVRRDTRFFNWMLRYLQGHQYRADLTIYQWDQVANPAKPDGVGTDSLTGFDGTLARTTQVFEAFPLTVKPAGDLDANADDISIAEITLAYEYFTIDTPGDLPAPTVPDPQ